MVISRFIIMVIVFPEYEVIMVRLENSVFIISANLSKKRIRCNDLIENLSKNTKNSTF